MSIPLLLLPGIAAVAVFDIVGSGACKRDHGVRAWLDRRCAVNLYIARATDRGREGRVVLAPFEGDDTVAVFSHVDHAVMAFREALIDIAAAGLGGKALRMAVYTGEIWLAERMIEGAPLDFAAQAVEDEIDGAKAIPAGTFKVIA